MRIAAVGAGLVAMGVLVSGAAGQIVPPPPGKTPPREQYVPPPPPRAPTPPTRPATGDQPRAADAPGVTILRHDDQGKVIPLSGPTELAAIEAMELDAEQRARVETALAARNAEVDKMVIERIADVMAFKEALDTLEPGTPFARMQEIANISRPLTPEKPIARLAREGVITPMQRAQLNNTVTTYKRELTKQIADTVGHDNVQGMTLAGFRFMMDETMAELDASLDRTFERSLGRTEELMRSAGVADAQIARAAREMSGAGDAKSRVAAVRTVFAEMTPEQRAVFLRAARPELE